MARAHRIRVAALVASVALSLGAGWLYTRFIGNDGTSPLDLLRTTLFVLTGFWLVWGGVAGVMGATAPSRRKPRLAGPPKGKTAVLMPIYNEDAAASFSRVAAMNRSLVALGRCRQVRLHHPVGHQPRGSGGRGSGVVRPAAHRARGRRPGVLPPARAQYRQEGRQYRGLHLALGRGLRLCADPRCGQPDGRRRRSCSWRGGWTRTSGSGSCRPCPR